MPVARATRLHDVAHLSADRSAPLSTRHATDVQSISLMPRRPPREGGGVGLLRARWSLSPSHLSFPCN